MGVLASGYGVMFTMLDDWRAEFGIQETGLSMIIAVGFFTSFIAQLTIAPYADRGHARKLMTVGMAANAAGALIMAFGSSLPLFLLGRFVMGVGAGIAIPAIKRIVIVSDPENMGGNLGRGVSIEVGGFAIGPVIAALTVDSINLAAPFILIAALITVAGFIISRLNITETAVEDRTGKNRTEAWSPASKCIRFSTRFVVHDLIRVYDHAIPDARRWTHPVHARLAHRHRHWRCGCSSNATRTSSGSFWIAWWNANLDGWTRSNVCWHHV